MIEENKTCAFQDNCNKVDCDKFCPRRFKTDYYFSEAMIEGDRRLKFPLRVDSDGSDIEAFSKLAEIESNIEDFVSKAKNLYIYSSIAGNGKSSWALRMARAYIDKNWFRKGLYPIVLFVSVPRFLLDLKSNMNKHSDYIEHILDNIFQSDLVIWDDIGNKDGTVFETDNLLSIINQRINSNKSNIYTSNLDADELHKALGDRLYSRVVNYSTVIEFKGADKRAIKGSDV